MALQSIDTEVSLPAPWSLTNPFLNEADVLQEGGDHTVTTRRQYNRWARSMVIVADATE